MKYYRLPWSKDKVDMLIDMWPHWGTDILAPMLNLRIQQVKSKVNKLKLTLLPKRERKCFECKLDCQVSRACGVFCKTCFSKKRKIIRMNHIKPKKIWVGDLLRTIRYRSKEPCDLTLEYLIDLWDNQKGLCFYSLRPMLEPKYGSGRLLSIASIDRIDSSRGYTKGNVVWCIWACNAGKNEMSVSDYILLCEDVIKNKSTILNLV
jgi:hypothetical protein